MPTYLVQSTTAVSNPNSTSVSQTITLNGTVVGNTIIVGVFATNNNGGNGWALDVEAMSDNVNSGNYSTVQIQGYTRDVAQRGLSSLYYKANNVGGNLTITYINSTSGGAQVSSVILIAAEYQNLTASPFDVYAFSNDSTGTALNSGFTPTTHFADEVIIGFGGAFANTATDTFTASTGYSIVQQAQDASKIGAAVMEEMDVTAIGSYAFTPTQSTSAPWSMICAAFVDPTGPNMVTNIIANETAAQTATTQKYSSIYAAGTNFGTSMVSSGAWNVMPCAGTFSKFYVKQDTADALGQSRTYQLFKSVAGTPTAQAITTTLATGVANNSDLTNTVTFAAGDQFAVGTSASGTTTSTGKIRWALGAICGPNQSMVLANTAAAMGTTFPVYIPVQGSDFDATAGTNVESVVPTGGTFVNAYVSLNSALNASTGLNFTLYKNGVATSLVVTVNASATGNDTNAGHAVAVVAGDRVYWKVEVQQGAPATKIAAVSAEFDPTVNGESIHTYGSLANQINTAARFDTLATSGAAYTATEGTVSALTLAATWKKLYVHEESVLSAGTFQYQPAYNTATGTLTVTMSSASQDGNDSTHSDTTANGDTISMKITPATSPTTVNVAWGIVSCLPLIQTVSHTLPTLGAGI